MKVKQVVNDCLNGLSFKIENEKVSYFDGLCIYFIVCVLIVSLDIVRTSKPTTVCNYKNTMQKLIEISIADCQFFGLFHLHRRRQTSKTQVK